MGDSVAEAVSSRLGTRCAVEGNHHLDGATTLSLHRVEHRDRSHQGNLQTLLPDGGGKWLRRRSGKTSATSFASMSRTPKKKRRWKNARQFMWMQGEFTDFASAHPVWKPIRRAISAAVRPPRLRRVRHRPGEELRAASADVPGPDRQHRMIVAGTPKQVNREAEIHLVENTVVPALWGSGPMMARSARSIASAASSCCSRKSCRK